MKKHLLLILGATAAILAGCSKDDTCCPTCPEPLADVFSNEIVVDGVSVPVTAMSMVKIENAFILMLENSDDGALVILLPSDGASERPAEGKYAASYITGGGPMPFIGFYFPTSEGTLDISSNLVLFSITHISYVGDDIKVVFDGVKMGSGGSTTANISATYLGQIRDFDINSSGSGTIASSDGSLDAPIDRVFAIRYTSDNSTLYMLMVQSGEQTLSFALAAPLGSSGDAIPAGTYTSVSEDIEELMPFSMVFVSGSTDLSGEMVVSVDSNGVTTLDMDLSDASTDLPSTIELDFTGTLPALPFWMVFFLGIIPI